MNLWTNNFFSQQILPGCYAFKAEKTILKNNIALQDSALLSLPKNNDLDEALTQLKNDLKNQYETKKGLEDKIKATLFSLTISITAITFSIAYEKIVLVTKFDAFALSLLVLSIFYFVFCAIIAVKTLEPVAFYQEHTEIKFNAENKSIEVKNENKQIQYEKFVKCKLRNDITNLIISNYTYASLKLLRNGIILFVIYFIVIVLQKNSTVIAKSSSFTKDTTITLNDTTRVNLTYTIEQNCNLLKLGKIELVDTRKKQEEKIIQTKESLKKQ